VFNFVDVPKPKAWPPPPKGSSRATELMEYSAKRDPVGDKIHTAFACLCLFCLPLATAPASISMALLFGYSLLRLPTTWRVLTPLLKSSVYWAVIAWVMYSTISIVWSEDSAQGLDHAKTMWLMAVPVPVLLWPVLRKWRWLIVAGLAGVLLQNVVQFSEIICSWFLDGNDWITGSKLERPSGFTKHNGTTAIYIASAVLVYAAIYLKGTTKRSIFVFFCLALFGAVVVQSRATWVGMFLATILLVSTLFLKKQTAMPKVFKLSGVSLVIIVLAVCSIGSFLTQRLSPIHSTMDTITQTPVSTTELKKHVYPTSTEYRRHWWIETTQLSTSGATTAQLFFGRGLGSSASIDYATHNTAFPKHAVHPHNMFVQILYEGGIIGVLTLCTMLVGIARRSIATQNALFLSLLLLWTTVAFFDGSQNSGRSLALLILFIPFSYMQSKVDKNV
jgi:hypothetical protein